MPAELLGRRAGYMPARFVPRRRRKVAVHTCSVRPGQAAGWYRRGEDRPLGQHECHGIVTSEGQTSFGSYDGGRLIAAAAPCRAVGAKSARSAASLRPRWGRAPVPNKTVSHTGTGGALWTVGRLPRWWRAVVCLRRGRIAAPLGTRPEPPPDRRRRQLPLPALLDLVPDLQSEHVRRADRLSARPAAAPGCRRSLTTRSTSRPATRR